MGKNFFPSLHMSIQHMVLLTPSPQIPEIFCKAPNMNLIIFQQKLKIRFLTDEADKFFTDLVHSTINFRQKNNIVIPDMIHLLMQARKDGKIKLEDEKTFQNAGFATVQEFQDTFKNSKINTAGG